MAAPDPTGEVPEKAEPAGTPAEVPQGERLAKPPPRQLTDPRGPWEKPPNGGLWKAHYPMDRQAERTNHPSQRKPETSNRERDCYPIEVVGYGGH